MKKPYRLKKRGAIYHYMLPWESCFHSTGCTRLRDAEHYALEQLKIGKEAKDSILFKDYVKDFFDWDKCRWIKVSHQKGRHFSKESASGRRGHVKNYLIPYLGDIPVHEISANDIDNMLFEIEVKPATKNRILDSISIIFDMALRDRLIDSNPTKVVSRFREDHKERDIFSLQELNTLFPQSPDALSNIWGSYSNAVFFATLAFAGIRVGECRVLEWDDIRFDLELITINKALKNGGEIGPTKNGEAREAILTERLSELLKPLQTDAEGPLVFPEMMRVPSDRRSYSKIFNTALRIAGIEVGERNLVPHSFRHTLNTLLRHEFGEDSLVMKLFGHKSSAMTDNYYNPSSAETSRFFSKHKDTINGLFSFKSKTSPGHHQSLEVAS